MTAGVTIRRCFPGVLKFKKMADSTFRVGDVFSGPVAQSSRPRPRGNFCDATYVLASEKFLSPFGLVGQRMDETHEGRDLGGIAHASDVGPGKLLSSESGSGERHQSPEAVAASIARADGARK
jgi:hypothetical protein